ncbi:MAG: DUF808 family protein, partial [Noviherbaspirillum sp.]
SILGTAAMFMVGGGILTHGVPALHHAIEDIAHRAGALPAVGGVLEVLLPTLGDALTGIVAGGVVLAGVKLAGRVFRTAGKQA